MKVFIAADGDTIGKLVGRARLKDDVEEIRRVSSAIEKGNKLFESYALANDGSVIEMGGDEVLIDVTAAALKDLENLRFQYFTATNATVSVGIGKKPSEASKALLAAKLRGRNRSVFYDDDVEKEVKEATEKPEDEKAKIIDESLAKAANNSAGGASLGTAVQDVIAANTLSIPGAPQTQETVDGAMNNGALPVPGQPIPQEAQPAQPAQPQMDVGSFKSQFRDHADKHELKQKANNLKTSDGYKKIKEKVADALENMQKQLPQIAQLRNQAPDAYEAILGVVQGLILLGRQLGDTDKKLEKIETLLKGYPDAMDHLRGGGTEHDFDTTLGLANSEMEKADLVPGGKADKKKPEEFDQEQLAIGTQHELEHTSDATLAQEIAMDHLTEDPDYYKKQGISEPLDKSEELPDHRVQALRELQYDGPAHALEGGNKHFFVNKSDGTNWVFRQTEPSEAYAAEASNNLARILKDDIYQKHPVIAHGMAGSMGIMEPLIENKQELRDIKPQQLTLIEKTDLMVECLIDWICGNSNVPGKKLLRTSEGRIMGVCKKDSFKDFEHIGEYYQNFLESVKNGTITFDLALLNPYWGMLVNIPDDEFLENVGRYAQCVWPEDEASQLSFAKLVLMRKRNAQPLFISLFKQSLQKGERPEYGKMRAHIDSPVGSTIFGKMLVRHWDGSKSWKSIKSGAILGLDPGIAGEGHAVSAKNPTAK
jgi:hypothetical protein